MKVKLETWQNGDNFSVTVDGNTIAGREDGVFTPPSYCPLPGTNWGMKEMNQLEEAYQMKAELAKLLTRTGGGNYSAGATPLHASNFFGTWEGDLSADARPLKFFLEMGAA